MCMCACTRVCSSRGHGPQEAKLAADLKKKEADNEQEQAVCPAAHHTCANIVCLTRGWRCTQAFMATQQALLDEITRVKTEARETDARLKAESKAEIARLTRELDECATNLNRTQEEAEV